MPLISIPNADEIVRDMLEHQIRWQLSDSEFGYAICGSVVDPGKIVRGWKSGADGRNPTSTAIQSFKYLKALVAITNNAPFSDAEENYAIAHSTLPECLK